LPEGRIAGGFCGHRTVRPFGKQSERRGKLDPQAWGNYDEHGRIVMKKKCDKCDKPATIHLTEIVGGEKIEKHLCEDCASAEGITIKANIPISQLLEDFVLQTSGEDAGPAEDQPVCEACGQSWSEFREEGQFGCPNDYEVFSKALVPMLMQMHEGASQHVGKVPHRAGQAQKRQNEMLRLRGELKQAVAAEDYERAAQIRDRIRQVEAE
jgi:protein arginine kinase activator